MAYTGWRRRRSFFAPDRELPRFQVVAASGSDVALSTVASGTTVGGVALVTDDVFLALSQTDPTQNGVYQVGGSAYGAHRPEWLCNMNQLIPGVQVQVRKGTFGGCTFELGVNTSAIGGADGFGVLPDAFKSWWFPVNGLPPRTMTVSADVGTWEGVILADATAGAVAVNLPDPSAVPASLNYGGRPGRTVAVVKTDAVNNVTVTCTTAAVHGDVTLAAQYDAQTYVSNGTAWYAIGTQ